MSNWFAIIGIGALLGGVGYVAINEHHINSNLEPDALDCPYQNNMWGNTWSLPKIMNMDVDGNGKFESIFVYEDENGKKKYQEVYRNGLGWLGVGWPKDLPK